MFAAVVLNSEQDRLAAYMTPPQLYALALHNGNNVQTASLQCLGINLKNVEIRINKKSASAERPRCRGH